ncbi:hypothetical protein NMY22_g1768 [Coprinellus aureogranulatus]|nr:hypothetical protein NMY22_g1768 [Coprinellus aureogranulatus]
MVFVWACLAVGHSKEWVWGLDSGVARLPQPNFATPGVSTLVNSPHTSAVYRAVGNTLCRVSTCLSTIIEAYVGARGCDFVYRRAYARSSNSSTG